MYRIAHFFPGLVTHVFSVCTPYFPPQKEYVPLEEVVKRIPFFGYQAFFASGKVEKAIRSKEEIRQFLTCLYGGRTPEGETGFDPMTGPFLDTLPKLGPSPWVTEEVSESLGFILRAKRCCCGDLTGYTIFNCRN